MTRICSPSARDTAALPPLRFDNTFVRELPGDPLDDNRSRQVEGACFSRVAPTPVARPGLVAFSREVAALIGLADDTFADESMVAVWAGNRLLPGMITYAACYGGHQFGGWAGQLGDGRAISLGEVMGTDGGRWELQLKGAGRTPYSRSGDGRAVLRSSIREFLCSEAMHHLGIPTTRALSVVTTGEAVLRDLLYDGHARPEPGAVVCRVAPSFLRFGNFEILAARGDHELLRRLADYAIARHFSPDLAALGPAARYARWFAEICQRTALLMVHWMRVGFVHGVMNTDNMSILGLTIDYGPYGWLESFDPGWTPNITDAAGRRYRYGAQPQVALWNLARFAQALVPLTQDPEPLQEALRGYADTYERAHRTMMAGKLGLPGHDEGGDPDRDLTDELWQVLTLVETDMTIFFRDLAHVPVIDPHLTDAALLAPLQDAYYDLTTLTPEFKERMAGWLRRYGAQVRASGISEGQRHRQMNAVNPRYVLRNYLAQLAIDDAEKGDPGKVHRLLELLRHPYDEQPGGEGLAGKRPEWARNRAGCSMLSCSS